MKVKIYTLDDPITKTPRYIGKTTRTLETRLTEHISKSLHRKSYVSNWISSLLKRKLVPQINLLEEVNGDWEKEEQFYISYFRYLGFDLTNLTIGGEQGTIGATWKVDSYTPKNKSILQFTLDGEFIKEWSSRIELAKHYNLNPITIGEAVNKFNYTNGTIVVNSKDYNNILPTPHIHSRNNPVIAFYPSSNEEQEYVNAKAASINIGLTISSICKSIKSQIVNSKGILFSYKYSI